MSATEKKKIGKYHFSGFLTFLSVFFFLFGFYLLGSTIIAGYSWYIRIAIFLVSVAISIGALMLTKHWNPMLQLAKGARIEMRKVVWPAKNEWLKMTWLVIVIVAVFSLFLMMIDGLLGFIIRMVLPS